jgi:hypothetical protein
MRFPTDYAAAPFSVTFHPAAICSAGKPLPELRWFTTLTEVNLCGHATLAAAYVLFNELDYPDSRTSTLPPG